jgi:hypothetical protein
MIGLATEEFDRTLSGFITGTDRLIRVHHYHHYRKCSSAGPPALWNVTKPRDHAQVKVL